MKNLLFITPLVFSSCMTQSDYIHLATSATMFTVCATQVEDWYLKRETKMDSIRPIREARRDSIMAPKIARRDSIQQIKIEKHESKEKKTIRRQLVDG